MKDLKEALIYATVNGITGFSVYTGAALFYGDQIAPAAVAGLGIGMLAFGSYMMKESDEVSLDVNEIMPTKRDKGTRALKNSFSRFIPSCVRKHGLFNFF